MQSTLDADHIVRFLRKRDYSLVKELGQGACGKTVLLYDDQIDEQFVCKKYLPYLEERRQELYRSFVREIKLLHQLHHENVVRVFNYYLYPEQSLGYILMEYIDGTAIDDFLASAPERTNELFLQAVSGFAYLERMDVLHRDIRPANIMVRSDGMLKIIDLGFGKQVQTPEDFDKSITLNWWCDPPNDFREGKYDFKTEVYFVGKLFESIVRDNDINHFEYFELLGRMCAANPDERIGRFSEIESLVRNARFPQINFDRFDVQTYRTFSAALCAQVTKLETGAKYLVDLSKLETQLADAYRNVMLEEQVPNAATVLRCFISGQFYYKSKGLRVEHVKEFIDLLKRSTLEKKRIILANLHAKLEAVPRYQIDDGEFPF